METPATDAGSLPSVEVEVSTVDEVKQKLKELEDVINRLPSDQAVQKDKNLEQELQKQITLKNYFQTQCNVLMENKSLLEKQVQDLEVSNLSQKAEITNLQKSLAEATEKQNAKAEESQQILRDNYAKILHSNKELLEKHNKLRDFVKAHLSDLQKLTDTNLSVSSQPVNERLASLSTTCSKRLTDMETSRQEMQESASVNSKLVTKIIKLVENRSKKPARVSRKTAKFKCMVCSGKFSSRHKLKIHRVVIHTVQKSWKFLQSRLSTKRRKLIVRPAKLKRDCAGNWNVIPSATLTEKSDDTDQNLGTIAENTEMSRAKENLSTSPSTTSQIPGGKTPVTLNVSVTESETTGKRKPHCSDSTTTRVTRSSSTSKDSPKNVDGVAITPKTGLNVAAGSVLQKEPPKKSSKTFVKISHSIKQEAEIKATTSGKDSSPIPSTSGSQQTNIPTFSGDLSSQDDFQIRAGMPPNSADKKRKRRKRTQQRKRIGKIFVCEWCPNNSVRYDQYINLRSHARSCHPDVANRLLKYACRVCAKTFNTREEAAKHRASEH